MGYVAEDLVDSVEEEQQQLLQVGLLHRQFGRGEGRGTYCSQRRPQFQSLGAGSQGEEEKSRGGSSESRTPER
jgi:hypothetical protein